VKRLAACLLMLASASARAGDPALLSKEMGVDPSKEMAETRLIEDVVVAPIPISNPTVGTGLAVVVMPFYHLGEGSPLSNTTLAGGLMSSGTWAVAVAQSTRLRGDELRVDGFLAYADLRYRFYGAGADAGKNGVSVPITQKGYAFAPELLFQVAKRIFLGLRYRGVRVETAVDGSTGALPPAVAEALPNSVTVTSSGLGPRVTFDTRDHDMNPSSGALLEFRANFADQSFGSDFDYQTYELSGRLTKLGRHDENDVVLAGPTVSARHATVRVEPIGVVLEDEGSLNGTFVNGERIEQRLLEEGDRIQVGPHLLLFVPAA